MTSIILLKTLTPLHVGASTGTGFADKPVQRDAAFGMPKVDGSVFKGALKRKYTEHNGRVSDKGNHAADILSFSDLKILLFPVKSSAGVFSLITCPRILTKLYSINKLCKFADADWLNSLIVETMFIGNDSAYIFDNGKVKLKNIQLGGYIFKVKNMKTSTIHFRSDDNSRELKELLLRAVILSDDNFDAFVLHFTEISTRNKISGESGTTVQKALFTQEYIPPETVFYGIISYFGNATFMGKDKCEEENAVKDFYRFYDNQRYIQLGGNAKLGKGIMEKIIRRGE